MQVIGVCCHWASFFKYNLSDTIGPTQAASSKGFLLFFVFIGWTGLIISYYIIISEFHEE